MIRKCHTQKDRRYEDNRPALRLPLYPPADSQPTEDTETVRVIEIDLNEGNVGACVINLVDDDC